MDPLKCHNATKDNQARQTIEEGERGGSPSTTKQLSASELSELERMANSNTHSGQAWVNVILREYSGLKQCDRVS